MIKTYYGHTPQIDETALIAEEAVVAGNVIIKKHANVWFHATIRAEKTTVTIGENTNIQDNAVIHVTVKLDTFIGNNVTVGHGAILHACTIEDNCLIGMGAILLDGCKIGSGSIIAAGSVVTPRTIIPPGSMVMGSPAKVKRQLSQEEIDSIKNYRAEYLEFAPAMKQSTPICE